MADTIRELLLNLAANPKQLRQTRKTLEEAVRGFERSTASLLGAYNLEAVERFGRNLEWRPEAIVVDEPWRAIYDPKPFPRSALTRLERRIADALTEDSERADDWYRERQEQEECHRKLQAAHAVSSPVVLLALSLGGA